MSHPCMSHRPTKTLIRQAQKNETALAEQLSICSSEGFLSQLFHQALSWTNQFSLASIFNRPSSLPLVDAAFLITNNQSSVLKE
eukprot:scaffold13544_cov50-Attheya_sp.AAC.2